MADIERTESDQALIQEVLRGDRDCFAVLMRRHQEGLYRVLRGVVRNHEDADDLLQEAFYRAYRYLDRFQLDRSFRPWLYKIGLNLAFHHLRKSRRGSWVRLDDEDPEGGASPMQRLADPAAEERIWQGLEERQLTEAMETLPPLYRSILVLRAVEGLHYEEIAEVVGIPMGTVMSRLSRARRALREILTDRPPGKLDKKESIEFPSTGDPRPAEK